MRRFLRRLAVGLVLSMAVAAGAAEDRPSVILVLDASGSMWGHLLDDQPKIAAAKQVVRDLLQDWDPNVNLGVTVYGHRQKGACDDIEPLIGLGPVDASAIMKRIDAIQPKGKTPMTEAVRRAAAELKYTESKASVILVSDGEETCDADPCAAAKQLEQAGVDLTVHTVGFDVVEKKGRDQLQCMAESTGGRFVLAQDAPALKKAIAEAVQVAVAKETPPPPPTAAPTEPPPPTEAVQAQAPAPEQSILPRGGHGYEDPVALPAGAYVVNWKLASDVFEYWKIQARAGQLVKIDLITSPEAGYTGGFLAGTDKKPLTREGCTNRPSSLQWLPSSDEEIYTYIFALGGCNGVAKGSGVTVSFQDRYDAGTSTDVGSGFDGALEVKPGTIEGFLSGQWGDDDKDYYRLKPVAAGSEIKVKIVPPTELGYNLTLYDQDRVQVEQKGSANAGAIARISWKAPEDQEEVFLLIEPRQKPTDLPFAPYKAEVELKPGS